MRSGQARQADHFESRGTLVRVLDLRASSDSCGPSVFVLTQPIMIQNSRSVCSLEDVGGKSSAIFW